MNALKQSDKVYIFECQEDTLGLLFPKYQDVSNETKEKVALMTTMEELEDAVTCCMDDTYEQLNIDLSKDGSFRLRGEGISSMLGL